MRVGENYTPITIYNGISDSNLTFFSDGYVFLKRFPAKKTAENGVRQRFGIRAQEGKRDKDNPVPYWPEIFFFTVRLNVPPVRSNE